MRQLNRRYLFVAGTGILLAALVAPGYGQRIDPTPTKDSRGLLVKETRNDRSSFFVRVSVDRASCRYYADEHVQVSVKSEKPGFLYLVYRDAEENVYCLFPNKFETNNRIPAMQEISIPAPGGNFALDVTSPFGEETLKAIVTTEKLDVGDPDAFTKGSVGGDPVSEVTEELAEKILTILENSAKRKGLRAIPTENDTSNTQQTSNQSQQQQQQLRDWADHSVTLFTEKSRKDKPPRRKRIGVFIGISDFKDPAIRDLAVCHLDAKEMQNAMEAYCDLDETICIVNQAATLEHIRQIFCKKLPQSTAPGDVIFIFWSGHGARCADTGGDESDGFDECLVPYDGSIADSQAMQETMLTDDMFGRWLLELDGRTVVVMVDACHSAGQGAQAKSISGPAGASALAAGSVEFDFLDNDLARTKDLGQKNTALLASSSAAEVSFERKEGDLSTMTFFLSQLLREKNSPLTLADAYRNIQSSVKEYVEDHFPGATQTVFLMENGLESAVLRP